jgi:hypothetical protein
MGGADPPTVLTHRLRPLVALLLIVALPAVGLFFTTALRGDQPELIEHLDAAPPGIDLGDKPSVTELVDEVLLDRYPGAGGARGAADEPVAAHDDAPRTAAAPTPPGKPGLGGLKRHVAPSCSGNGKDGNRVQVIYAVEKGKTDRYKKLLPALRSYVADVDDTFAMSSKKTRGNLRVRWVHTKCTPVIAHEVLPAGSLRKGFKPTVDALKKRGYTSKARKYLVFADDTKLCGVGQLYNDAAKKGNYNDGRVAMFARVDSGCWAFKKGWHSTAAHEVMHMLGGVQHNAPHSTPAGHCRDERDAMCYDDDGRGKVTMKHVCRKSAGEEALFDCRNDDYFHTAPKAGSYLARYWNTAKSSFLDKVR